MKKVQTFLKEAQYFTCLLNKYWNSCLTDNNYRNLYLRLTYKNIGFYFREVKQQIWLCLFTFQPIASKQLNGLTTIDTLSWLGGAVVTHPLWVQEVPGSIPSSGKGFYVWIFVLLLCFYLFVQKHIIYQKGLQFLLQC